MVEGGRIKLTLTGPDRWQNGKEVAFHMNNWKVVGFVPAGFLDGTDASVEFGVTPFFRFFRF